MRSLVVTGLNPMIVKQDAAQYLQGAHILWEHGPDPVELHEFRKAQSAVQPTSVPSFSAFAPNQQLFVFVAYYEPA